MNHDRSFGIDSNIFCMLIMITVSIGDLSPFTELKNIFFSGNYKHLNVGSAVNASNPNSFPSVLYVLRLFYSYKFYTNKFTIYSILF